MTAQALGIRTVFTDHSLFSFDEMAVISINKVMKWVLANVDAAICVSHANRDNLTLRAYEISIDLNEMVSKLEEYAQNLANEK